MTAYDLWNRYRQFVDPEMPWIEFKNLHLQFLNDLIYGKRRDRKKYIKYLKNLSVEEHMKYDKFTLISDILNYK